MKSVTARGEQLVIHFDAQEAELLASLGEQLVELLGQEIGRPGEPRPGAAGSEDPFAAWEREFSLEDPFVQGGTEGGASHEGSAVVDPVVQRLFPDAYRDDPVASHDFRRFTQAAQRDAKVQAARVVLDGLAATDRYGRCRLPRSDADAWLKTLANLRLSLAARLGITDEISADEAAHLPEEDPRAWLHEIYSWLGWVQECLVEAL